MRGLSRIVIALVVLVLTTPVRAAQEPAAPLDRLKAGNARFLAGALPPETGASRRQQLTAAQHPYAVVLSCADSRVPPEYVFNAGLGDLFVVRVAGEVTDKSVLASVEYAVEHLNVQLVVVMGHEVCGAVKAAVDAGREPLGPNLDYLVHAIEPAVQRTAGERDRLRAAILANVDQVVHDTLAGSVILHERADSGRLQIVGAYYELGSGKVTFAEPLTTEQARTIPSTAGRH